MTGLQLFIKLNATLMEFGQDQVDDPPPVDLFAANAPQSVTITNTAGVIAIKLAKIIRESLSPFPRGFRIV
jgi:hypothetical protein